MKINFLSFLFILLSISTFAQTKNNIALQYGLSSATVNIHGAIGDYGYDTKSGMNFGVVYTREISRHFSLQTGLLFVRDKVQLNYITPNIGQQKATGDVKLISIPIIAKLTFFKYLFADAGFSLDAQSNYSGNAIVDKQSDLGVEIGMGGKYSLSRFTVFVNPYLHSYAITRIDNNLFEAGARIGAGYNF